MKPKPKPHPQSQSLSLSLDDDDDDFQNPISSSHKPKPSSSKPKRRSISDEKENDPNMNTSYGAGLDSLTPSFDRKGGHKRYRATPDCAKDGVCTGFQCKNQSSLLVQSTFVESTINESAVGEVGVKDTVVEGLKAKANKKKCKQTLDSKDHIFGAFDCDKKKGFEFEYKKSSNSIESRLLASSTSLNRSKEEEPGAGTVDNVEEFECGTQLNVLIELCEENMDTVEMMNEGHDGLMVVECPLCGVDISGLSEEQRQLHTNECLDRDEDTTEVIGLDLDRPVLTRQVIDKKVTGPSMDRPVSARQDVDVSSVLEWLHDLGLSRYEEVFIREEVDWDTLQWLSEEDLFSIGVDALGPRKKIVHALNELRKLNLNEDPRNEDSPQVSSNNRNVAGNKLITEYFPGSSVVNKKSASSVPSRTNPATDRNKAGSSRKKVTGRIPVKNGKVRDVPIWCRIPGTPFQVDAFRYLRGDCSHWFLTHFHMDHYQGLTRSFSHGKIYCSLITARLVNTKIGIPFDKIQVLPLNQKISIAGVDVTCLDANHCPGAVIILFEPPNGKAILHTGDFRFNEQMTDISMLKSCPVQTLILDTTYCNPQYDFPKQEAVIQFVIESIQAEAFNPKTLFLIGSYTIGKERLYLEVARFLRKKVYVGAPKMRLLECLGLPKEDMQWLTMNEHESHIHVVPIWTIASFKRMKHMSSQYSSRFNLIIAFSPTGWTFGKGKKTTPWRKCQHGTIIRYEVPYSEHSSFTELKEFVKFISPENILPSVNNDSQESSDAMLSLLMS